MGSIGIWLLAVSLAMDCFSVALASGMILKKVERATFLKMSFFFGLFQGLMPVIGWAVAKIFSEYIRSCDHWVAFFLLSFLGVRMIVESFKDEDKCHFDPRRLSVILALAVATSIDALAVGVTFAFIDMDAAEMLYSVGVIGLVSFLFALIGNFVGVKVRQKLRFRMEWIGGVVLIGLGVKILCEHTGIL